MPFSLHLDGYSKCLRAFYLPMIIAVFAHGPRSLHGRDSDQKLKLRTVSIKLLFGLTIFWVLSHLKKQIDHALPISQTQSNFQFVTTLQTSVLLQDMLEVFVLALSAWLLETVSRR